VSSYLCSTSRYQILVMAGILIAIVLLLFFLLRSVFHASSVSASAVREVKKWMQFRLPINKALLICRFTIQCLEMNAYPLHVRWRDVPLTSKLICFLERRRNAFRCDMMLYQLSQIHLATLHCRSKWFSRPTPPYRRSRTVAMHRFWKLFLPFLFII